MKKIMHKNKTVIIGITSGIAAYKIIDVVRILRAKRIDVCCIMTDAATKMVPAADFENASGHKVYTTLFPQGFQYKKILEDRKVEHVELADKASLFVIAPATANTISKVAAGIADNFLTTTVLATKAPVLICPSMNVHMWNNKIIQENIEKLQQRGFSFLHPQQGALACGYTGVGRLADVSKIAEKIFSLLARTTQLQGKKVIVTAGGTIEPIDAVRIITNRSSGKMGIALAEACFEQGADVLLLRSAHAVKAKYPIKEKLFETVDQLSQLLRESCQEYATIFHVAAVSDFTLAQKYSSKISSSKPLILRLHPTVKILDQIKQWNPKMRVIAFKAEYNQTEKNLIQKGREKLNQNSADVIIVNDIGKKGIGFDSEENEVYIISRSHKVVKIPKSSKTNIAKKIIEIVFN